MIRQQRQPPLRQTEGEEEADTGNEVSAVRGHDAILSRNKRDGFRKGSTHPTGCHRSCDGIPDPAACVPRMAVSTADSALNSVN